MSAEVLERLDGDQMTTRALRAVDASRLYLRIFGLLPPRELEVFLLRRQRLTLGEIAERWNMSKARVWQIERRAQLRIREDRLCRRFYTTTKAS